MINQNWLILIRVVPTKRHSIALTKKQKNRLKFAHASILNNIVEQDHRNIKRITRLMLGFKNFHSAQKTLAGIELMKMIIKGQMILPKGDDLSPAEQFYLLAA